MKGCFHEDEVRAAPGIGADRIKAVGFDFIKLTVKNKLIDPVKGNGVIGLFLGSHFFQ